jgi:type IV pilus assembly protein PilM
MAKAKAAWGIEIGSAAIKAIRLERDGSDVRVADFVIIPHPKVLTTPDLNIEEMLRISLGAFMTQKSLEGAVVVLSVPGNEGLARFAKLPPIPKKAVPQTVMFEARQQIPFPLEEVEWDYHLFASDESPELEVGIFAILKEKIAQRLSLYKELGLRPSAMTLGPIAVYNAMVFDRDLDQGGKPVMAFLDIGTRSSDLVVIEEGRAWIRTFPIGGHHFTEAIASAFSVPYGKADRLKAEAATHKYAKQLMHAMRPVFDDLLQEVQRSIGHYGSLHPDKPIERIVGLGSTFRIPGLRKFLSDQLGTDIRRLEEFEKVKVEGSAASDFTAAAMNLTTAVGLALQGLGYGEIGINLSPVGNLREQVWAKKAKWFVAAAALMTVGAALLFWRPGGAVAAEPPAIVRIVKQEGESAKKKFEEAKTAADLGSRANNMIFLLDDREVWPWITSDVHAALASAGPQAELLADFDHAKPPVELEKWNTVDLESLSGVYKFVNAQPKPKRTIEVTVRCVVPRDERNAKVFVTKSILEWLAKNADRKEAPYVIVVPQTGITATFAPMTGSSAAPGAGAGTPSGAAAEEAPPEQAASEVQGAGTMKRSANTSGSIIVGKGGQLGGAGFGGNAGGDAAPPPEATGEQAAASSAAKRKAERKSIATAAAEPINIDQDAAIPPRPNPLAGKSATQVTIKFTLELRDPVGRDLAVPAAPGAEGADGAPAEGENPEGEPK